MGTHPIFESDFDCLTEICVRMNDSDIVESPPKKKLKQSVISFEKPPQKPAQIKAVNGEPIEIFENVKNGDNEKENETPEINTDEKTVASKEIENVQNKTIVPPPPQSPATPKMTSKSKKRTREEIHQEKLKREQEKAEEKKKAQEARDAEKREKAEKKEAEQREKEEKRKAREAQWAENKRKKEEEKQIKKEKAEKEKKERDEKKR